MNLLPSKIDVIQKFEVGKNFTISDRAFDLSIVSEFNSKEDLETYAVHPAHLEFVEFNKSVSEIVKVVDFEMDEKL